MRCVVPVAAALWLNLCKQTPPAQCRGLLVVLASTQPQQGIIPDFCLRWFSILQDPSLERGSWLPGWRLPGFPESLPGG